MICPKCGAEYREGFYTCADCNVSLVNENENSVIETPADDEAEESGLVAILETENALLLSDLVDLIEKDGIPYLVQSGTVLGFGELQQSDDLVWRAVLSVPQRFTSKVREVMATLKAQSDSPDSASDSESE